MPRQIDLFPQNLKVDHDPTKKLALSKGQISQYFADLPEEVLASFKTAVTEMLSGINSQTGLNLPGWSGLLSNLLNRAEDDTSDLLTDFTSWLSNVGTDADQAWTNIWDFLDGGEWTDLKTAWDRLTTAIFGDSTTPSALTTVSSAAISKTSASLQPVWDFPTVQSLVAGSGWSWDGTVDHTGTAGSGSACYTCSGVEGVLNGIPGPVQPGQIVTPTAYVTWSGLTAAEGTSPIQLWIIPFSGSVLNLVAGQEITIDSITSPAESGDWTELSGSYTVPSDGSVTAVQIALAVTADATAGTVWWDDCTSDITQGGFIDDWLYSLYGSRDAPGPVAQILQSSVSGLINVWDNIFGVGADPTSGGILQSAVKDLTAAWTNLFGSGNDPTSSQVQASSVASTAGGSSLGDDLLSYLSTTASAAGTLAATPINAANDGINLLANTLNGLSAKVQNSLTQQSGADNSGQAFQVSFANYPSGAFSAAPFNVTYGPVPGSGLETYGTGILVLANGDATWDGDTDGDVSVIGVFNNGGTGQAYTDTDYQELQATIGGLPSGVGAINYGVLRSNAAGTTYTYGCVYLSASFTLNWELGCVNNGVNYVWAGGSGAPLNFNFTIVAGVGTNPDRYQGISGDTVIFDHTNTASDPGGIFPVGPTQRYWGFRSDTYNNGKAGPAPASYVGCADNAPPSAKGSGFRAYCSNATEVSAGTSFDTPMYFPEGFWDTIYEATLDISVSTNTSGQQQITVGLDGWYGFAGRCGMDLVCGRGSVTVSLGIMQMRGGVQTPQLLPGVGFGANGASLVFGTSAFGGSANLYCEAGDVLIPFYYLEGNPSGTNNIDSFSIFGDASGQTAWWSICLANLSLN